MTDLTLAVALMFGGVVLLFWGCWYLMFRVNDGTSCTVALLMITVGADCGVWSMDWMLTMLDII